MLVLKKTCNALWTSLLHVCGYKIKYIQDARAVLPTDLWVSDDDFVILVHVCTVYMYMYIQYDLILCF